MAAQRVRALIVDDDPDMRLLVRTVIELANEGLEVAGEAANGSEGVQQFWDLRPDVMIVDQRMPDMTGVDMVRQLHNASARPDVIFFSAYLADDVVEQMEAIGACAVLGKDAVARIPDAVWTCVGS